MKIKSKLLMSTGIIASTAIPALTVVSCGSSSDNWEGDKVVLGKDSIYLFRGEDNTYWRNLLQKYYDLNNKKLLIDKIVDNGYTELYEKFSYHFVKVINYIYNTNITEDNIYSGNTQEEWDILFSNLNILGRDSFENVNFGNINLNLDMKFIGAASFYAATFLNVKIMKNVEEIRGAAFKNAKNLFPTRNSIIFESNGNLREIGEAFASDGHQTFFWNLNTFPNLILPNSSYILMESETNNKTRLIGKGEVIRLPQKQEEKIALIADVFNPYTKAIFYNSSIFEPTSEGWKHHFKVATANNNDYIDMSRRTSLAEAWPAFKDEKYPVVKVSETEPYDPNTTPFEKKWLFDMDDPWVASQYKDLYDSDWGSPDFNSESNN